jgi:hypothetical protein
MHKHVILIINTSVTKSKPYYILISMFINAGVGGSLESRFEHMKLFGNWWHQRRHAGNNDSFTEQWPCESRNLKTDCLYIKDIAGQPLHQKLFHLIHIMQVPPTVHTSHFPHHMTHFFPWKILYKVILCLNVQKWVKYLPPKFAFWNLCASQGLKNMVDK